jgi:glycerate kinase
MTGSGPKLTHRPIPLAIVGGGAAGGIGCALSVFLNGKMTSGIETLLDLVDFDSALKNADFVISGEGRIDSQSAQGKVIFGIGQRCKKQGVPLICIAGGTNDGYEAVYDIGVTKIYTLVNESTSLDEAIKNAETVYRARAKEMLNDIKKGAN